MAGDLGCMNVVSKQTVRALLALASIGLVLSLSSCRLFEFYHAGQDNQAQLHGGYDQHHVLHLKMVDQAQGIAAFEVCLRDSESTVSAVVQASCVNPFKVVEVLPDGRLDHVKRPLLMHLEYLQKEQLSQQEISYLLERQDKIIKYIRQRQDITLSSTAGMAGLAISATSIGSILSQSGPLKLGHGVRLILSVLLLAGSSISLLFAENTAVQHAATQEELRHDQTPRVLATDPAEWFVVFENIDQLLSLDGHEHAAILSLEDIIPKLGMVMHLRKFIAPTYQIVEYCLPYAATDTMSTYITKCKPLLSS